MNGEKLQQNLHTFLRHLDAINETMPMTMLLLQPYQTKAVDKYMKFLETSATEIEDEDGKKAIAVKYEESKIYEKLSKNSETSVLASKIIPESLFVSLISQYDSFFNRLLRALFEIQPEIINNSDRNLTFSQLVKFENFETAKEYVVEKEVETVLRKNHCEHFEYLETKLAIPLRKNLPIWKTFIEITERRNLLVHCDGVVTNQYLKVCGENKCEIADVELNQRLKITPEYFICAYKCLFEIATKLTHTIWRKLMIEDIKKADEKLNEICFDLINSQHFELADILLEFACGQNKFYNDAYKNIFIVNKALSKYLQGNKDGAQKIINSKDWSASSDDFKIAHLVLNEEFEKCYILMKKIGRKGEVDRQNYKTWPLFLKIRKEKIFKEVYKEIFDEDYTLLEIPKSPIQELIEKEIKNNPELKEKVVKKELSEKEIRKNEEEQKEEVKKEEVKK